MPELNDQDTSTTAVPMEPWERPLAGGPLWDVSAEWKVMAQRMAAGQRAPKRSVWVRYGVGIAATLLFMVAGYAVWHNTYTAEATVSQKEIVTNPGQRTNIQLSDGSMLTIAPGSRVRYDTEFGKKTRDIYLEGQALFTVANASGIPFIVHSSNSTVRVLGTRFGIRTYGNSVEIAVASGRISVGAHTLSTNDVAAINGVETTVAHNASVADMLAWAEGKLIFKDTPLDSAIPELERWFNIDIKLADSALASRHLSGTLMDQSAGDAIQALNILLGTRAELKGREVILHTR